MRLTTGQVFNFLTVVDQAESKHGKLMWNCLCVCGASKLAMGLRLVSGKTKSCGCKTNRGTTHGQSGSHTYTAWADMKARCINPDHPRYHNYGGCGATICKEWMNFEGFLNDMEIRPEGAVLVRKKGTSEYCKANCSWEGGVQMVMYQGEKITVIKLAEKLGRPVDLVTRKLTQGWNPHNSE